MTTEAQAKQLQDILNARLPVIDRWEKVEVTQDGVNGLIRWSQPKRGNIHGFETKEFPVKDFPVLIERNVARLANETKTYK